MLFSVVFIAVCLTIAGVQSQLPINGRCTSTAECLQYPELPTVCQIAPPYTSNCAPSIGGGLPEDSIRTCINSVDPKVKRTKIENLIDNTVTYKLDCPPVAQGFLCHTDVSSTLSCKAGLTCTPSTVPNASLAIFNYFRSYNLCL